MPNIEPRVIGTLTIAAELPLSGDDAPDGLPVQQAMELALKEAGRVCGTSAHRDACVTLQLKAYDDVNQGIHDPATGAASVTRMVNDDRIIGMIGPLYDSLARSEIPVANRAHLAMVSPANTDECLTQEPSDGRCRGLAARLRPGQPNNFFRVVTTQVELGPAAAELAFRTLGKRRAYVARDQSLIGPVLASGFMSRFTRDGGKVVESPALADVVFFAGDDLEAAAALRRELGGRQPPVPLIGNDRLANNQFAKAVGGLARDSYYTVVGVYPTAVKAAAGFLAAYRKAYGHDASRLSLQAFDATNLMVHAIGDAIDDAGGRKPSRGQVLSAISRTAYPGLMGRLSFDKNGDSTLKLVTAFEWQAATAISGEFVTEINVH